MAAILTRTRRTVDGELPELMSDADLLAWGRSLVEDPSNVWAPGVAGASDLDGGSDLAGAADLDGEIEKDNADGVGLVDLAGLPIDVDHPEPGNVVTEPHDTEPHDPELDDPELEDEAAIGAVGTRGRATPLRATPVTADPFEERSIARDVPIEEPLSIEEPPRVARVSRERRELVALRRQLTSRGSRSGATRREPLKGYKRTATSGSRVLRVRLADVDVD